MQNIFIVPAMQHGCRAKTSMAKLSLENKNKDMADQVPLISLPPTPSLLSLFSSSAFIFLFLTLRLVAALNRAMAAAETS